MIWVISSGEAFWQHHITGHPKHLLQHLTVVYSLFNSHHHSEETLRQEAGKLYVCPWCVYTAVHGVMPSSFKGVSIWAPKIY